MLRQLYYISIGLILLLYSCSNDTDNDHSICEDQIIVSSDDFNNALSDQIANSTLEIKDNCLRIALSASGCDGNTWIVQLIASEEILYSEPPQQNIKLSFQNNEFCTTVISKEFTFDITSLQLSGNQIVLNIVNTGDQILYEY